MTVNLQAHFMHPNLKRHIWTIVTDELKGRMNKQANEQINLIALVIHVTHIRA